MPESEGYETLARRCLKHGWRLDALDQWRKELDHRVSVLESEVTTEREARMMREALDARGRNTSAIRFTRAQIVGGLVVGAVTIADLVVRLATIGHG